MASVRRTYVFLVSAISLQTLTWVSIMLLQGLLPPGATPPVTTIALEIAALLVGLPFYLVHWVWAERLAQRDPDEHGSLLRRIYLYGMLAAFLTALVVNAFNVVFGVLLLAFNLFVRSGFETTAPLELVINSAATMIVLLLLWLYHEIVRRSDANAMPEMEIAAGLRRLYIYGFGAAGLTMLMLAAPQLLRFVMFQIGDGVRSTLDTYGLLTEITRILIGLGLWLIFWTWGQKSFVAEKKGEIDSLIRKLYLYAVIFFAVLAAVWSSTLILVGFLRSGFQLAPNGDIRDPLSVAVVFGVIWSYHASVLRRDTLAAGRAPHQAAIRRLYSYLVAGIGFGAFLIGLGGNVSVLIRSVAGESFDAGMKEQLAWFTAVLIAGLFVWILPWRTTQLAAVAPRSDGAEERRSIVRKLYLYFYLFVASMTLLGCAIYILYPFLGLALGERIKGNLLSDLAHAIAYALIAVGVWLYHGAVLRGDGRMVQSELASRLENYSVVVVDTEQGEFGLDVIEGLKRELPGLNVVPVGFSSHAREIMGVSADAMPLATYLENAKLIVGSWLMAVTGGAVTADLVNAIKSSHAQKLVVPTVKDGWIWSGIEPSSSTAVAQETVRAIKRIVEGQDVKSVRGLNPIAIVALVIGAPVVLFILLQIIAFFLFGSFD